MNETRSHLPTSELAATWAEDLRSRQAWGGPLAIPEPIELTSQVGGEFDVPKTCDSQLTNKKSTFIPI